MRLLFLIPVFSVILFSALVSAEEKKKPQTWEDKKAEKFKGKPNDDQKDRIKAALPKATAEAKKERKVLCFWRCEG
ncbi:MAG: hypothetical protein AAF226_16020, partial [Verrucomicrobiota bacterium]